MRGVSEFVLILLILIVAVISISILWLAYYGYFKQITSSEGTSTLGEALSSCMKIDSVKNYKIYLKNCGSGFVKNNTLKIYLDEEPVSFSMSPASIGKGEVAEIKLHEIWGISIGNHKIKITNPVGKVERYVKSILPDSCVLALDFDEGTGNITYDKSGYGNNGVLDNESSSFTCGVNGACPSWVTGKFGYALNFDGIGDRVYLGTSLDPPQNGMTISLLFWWNGPKSTEGTPNGYQSFMAKQDTWNMNDMRWELERGWDQKFIRLINPNDGNNFGYSLIQKRWTHIIVSQNSTNRVLYVDGNFYRALPKLIFGNDPTSHVDIGSGFNGTIDSVRVCNKALTPDETVVLKLGELT